MRIPRFAAAILALISTSTVAQNILSGEGTPVVFGTSYDVPAKSNGATRQINVLLPAGYDDPDKATVRYPVLYLLDGGTGWQDFVHIASMTYQGGLWGGNAPMIVVGIESKDRRAEFTSPSSDPQELKEFPTSGQAELFRRFLTQELKPAIEAAYRTNGTDGLIGESLAGLFVVDTALHHGGNFDRYIAVSPSLWWSNGALAGEAESLLDEQPQTSRTLWLSMADEGGTMQTGMDRLVAALRATARSKVTWTYVPFPQEKHSTIYHPAATQAIRAVFPPPLEPAP